MDYSSLLFWVYVVVGLTVIVGFGLYYFFVKSFNKQIRVIIEGNNGNKHIIDTARLVIDKDNLAWWQLRKLKDQIAVPEKKYIYFNEKGKECLDLIKKGDLDYQPITIIENHIEKKIGYGAISQQSKMNYAYQFRKSLELKQNTLGAMIEKYAPYLILIIVFVIGIIVYDSIGKKVVEMATIQAGMVKDMQLMEQELVQAQLIVNANLRNQTVIPTAVPLRG